MPEEDKRRIRLHAGCNHSGGDYTDFIKLPEDWDSWTPEQQEKWGEERAEEHFWNSGYEYSHKVTDTDDEEYQSGWYSDASED